MPKPACLHLTIDDTPDHSGAVTCSAEDWEDAGDAFCEAHPVQRVTFTNYAPPIEADDDVLRGEAFVYPFHVAGRTVEATEVQFHAAQDTVGMP